MKNCRRAGLRAATSISRTPRLNQRNFATGAAFALRSILVARRATTAMHEIIYLIGLVVVVMFILGLLGVR
jgi:hypothetical protein